MTTSSLLPQASATAVPSLCLSPSAVLERFVPPEGLLWSGPAALVERNRYGFRIGTFGLLIKADVGSEVLRSQSISSLPGSAPCLMGLLNLRGNLVPVFDLGLLLGVDKADQSGTMLILILDKGENAVGMVIDGFPQALLGLHTIRQLPQLPSVLQEHVSAGYVKDEYIWLEFNHESFFETLTRASANH